MDGSDEGVHGIVMKTVGFCGSASEECAPIRDFVQKRNAELIGVIETDGAPYRAFRSLQSVIKLQRAQVVVTPSFGELAPDRYLCLEMKLFIERNGAKLVTLDGSGPDPRREIACAVSRFFSLPEIWEVAQGTKLPRYERSADFKRVPPFGYRMNSGAAIPEPREAEAVRAAFAAYAEGRPIKEITELVRSICPERRPTLMTVKTILRNERYIGARSKKGYSLPPLVEYGLWLKAGERYERGREAPPAEEPLRGLIHADRSFRIIRDESAKRSHGRPTEYAIDAEALDRAASAAINVVWGAAASRGAFADFCEAEAENASNALLKAEKLHDETLTRFSDSLGELRSGAKSEELFERLDVLADMKNVIGMQVRRTADEMKLYTLPREETEEFFSRAYRFPELSAEERGFMAKALFAGIRIVGGSAAFRVRTPYGRVRRIPAEGILTE